MCCFECRFVSILAPERSGARKFLVFMSFQDLMHLLSLIAYSLFDNLWGVRSGQVRSRFCLNVSDQSLTRGTFSNGVGDVPTFGDGFCFVFDDSISGVVWDGSCGCWWLGLRVNAVLMQRTYITRWFKYDRGKLWLVYTQSVPDIFEPPFTFFSVVHSVELRIKCTTVNWC